MNLEKVLKSGDEVRIKGEKDIYVTAIDEVTGEDTFTILAPYKQGQQVILRQNETLSVSCVTKRGLLMFDVRVTEIDNTSNVVIIHLKALNEAKRLQRRQAFRVREAVTVNARKKADEKNPEGKWVKTSTVDISELGMLLRFNEKCEDEQELEMTISLNMFGINEVIPKVKGKVVRCISTKNKDFGFLMGISFEDLPEKARNALLKFVVLSQRNKLSSRKDKNSK